MPTNLESVLLCLVQLDNSELTQIVQSVKIAMKVVVNVKILVITVLPVRLLTVGLKAINVLIQTLPFVQKDYSN